MSLISCQNLVCDNQQACNFNCIEEIKPSQWLAMSEKSIIQWLIDHDIVKETKTCTAKGCDNQMKLNRKKFYWYCNLQQCRKSCAILNDTWFSGRKMSLAKRCALIAGIAQEMAPAELAKHTDVSPETCKEFKQSICELIHSDWEKIAKSKEGKLSRIQIDETSRNKRYGGLGRRAGPKEQREQQWLMVINGVDVETNKRSFIWADFLDGPDGPNRKTTKNFYNYVWRFAAHNAYLSTDSHKSYKVPDQKKQYNFILSCFNLQSFQSFLRNSYEWRRRDGFAISKTIFFYFIWLQIFWIILWFVKTGSCKKRQRRGTKNPPLEMQPQFSIHHVRPWWRRTREFEPCGKRTLQNQRKISETFPFKIPGAYAWRAVATFFLLMVSLHAAREQKHTWRNLETSEGLDRSWSSTSWWYCLDWISRSSGVVI